VSNKLPSRPGALLRGKLFVEKKKRREYVCRLRKAFCYFSPSPGKSFLFFVKRSLRDFPKIVDRNAFSFIVTKTLHTRQRIILLTRNTLRTNRFVFNRTRNPYSPGVRESPILAFGSRNGGYFAASELLFIPFFLPAPLPRQPPASVSIRFCKPNRTRVTELIGLRRDATADEKTRNNPRNYRRREYIRLRVRLVFCFRISSYANTKIKRTPS